MIEVGTKIVGNWGANHPYSYGVVTDVYHFRGEERVIVDFDDLDGLTEYNESEFMFANGIDKIGVFIDHEELVY